MKKRFLSLLCAVVLTVAVIGTAIAQEGEADIVPYSDTSLMAYKDCKLYSEASIYGRELDDIKIGDKVTKIENINIGWMRVLFNHQNGYVQSDNFVPSVNCYVVPSGNRIPMYSFEDITYADEYLYPGTYLLSNGVIFGDGLIEVTILASDHMDSYKVTSGYVRLSQVIKA